MPALVALVVAVLAVPALANSLTFRAERPVAPPEYAPVAHVYSGAQIAANGETYLAIWTDRRGGPPTLYASRLRADGTVLDRTGVRIAPGAFAGSVIWPGRSFLMAYIHERTIFVRTMHPDGTLGAPIAVIEREHDVATEVKLATNGGSVLLIEPFAKGALLDLDGNKLRDVQLGWTDHPYNGIEVAAAGSTYLVAAAAKDLVVQSVSANGHAAPPRLLAENVSVPGIALASDGTRLLALWPRNSLEGQLVGVDGAPIGPVRQLTSLPSRHPDVEWRGGEFFATFVEQQSRAVHGIRLSREGELLTQPTRAAATTKTEVDLATRGESGAAVWAASGGGIEAGLFDAQSVAGTDPFRAIVKVSVAAHPQFGVKLARSGATSVAAWMEVIGTTAQVRLAHTVGLQPVIVSEYAERLVDVVVADNTIWVVWANLSHIAFRRYTTSLQPIDDGPQHFDFDGDPQNVVAAAGGGALVFAWPEQSEQGSTVHMAILRRGNLQRLNVAQAEFAHHVALAWTGSEFVAGWADDAAPRPDPNQPPAWPEDDVRAVRVSIDGEVGDAITVADQGLISIRTILIAPAAGGVAFAWQSRDRTCTALVSGDIPGPIRELGGENAHLRALEPHEAGLLLVRGTVAFGPVVEMATTTIESLLLDPTLDVKESGTLPPFESDSFWGAGGDFDAIGGLTPVIGYGQVMHGAEYGGVARIFVRSAGRDGRRRSVR